MNLEIKNIIEDCLNHDPFFRPSISQVRTDLHTLLSAANESEPEPASAIPTTSVSATTSHSSSSTLTLIIDSDVLAEIE